MSNYEISLGAVMAINESGIKSPEDISLIGFDNLILSKVVKPKLYMVIQPMKEIGEQAVELLLKRMNSREKELPVEIVMSTMIQKGDSIRML